MHIIKPVWLIHGGTDCYDTWVVEGYSPLTKLPQGSERISKFTAVMSLRTGRDLLLQPEVS